MIRLFLWRETIVAAYRTPRTPSVRPLLLRVPSPMSQAEYETLILRRHGQVQEIGFNRPHRLNAATETLSRERNDALTPAEAAGDVPAVPLTDNARASL